MRNIQDVNQLPQWLLALQVEALPAVPQLHHILYQGSPIWLHQDTEKVCAEGCDAVLHECKNFSTCCCS